MKTPLATITALLALASAAFAKDLVNVNWSGVAVKGYDPVAYFTDGKAVKGDSQFQSTDKGAIYYFASAEHKAVFDKDLAKYEPQFGGFCAYAVSQNHTAPISPEAFQIVDGRLLLQYDLGIREKFNKDAAGNLEKADANWPGIVEKKGK
jgi:YHS domain-containing protein